MGYSESLEIHLHTDNRFPAKTSIQSHGERELMVPKQLYGENKL